MHNRVLLVLRAQAQIQDLITPRAAGDEVATVTVTVTPKAEDEVVVEEAEEGAAVAAEEDPEMATIQSPNGCTITAGNGRTIHTTATRMVMAMAMAIPIRKLL
jgi:hypothetical protein